jgi:hypothetical protein
MHLTTHKIITLFIRWVISGIIFYIIIQKISDIIIILQVFFKLPYFFSSISSLQITFIFFSLKLFFLGSGDFTDVATFSSLFFPGFSGCTAVGPGCSKLSAEALKILHGLVEEK